LARCELHNAGASRSDFALCGRADIVASCGAALRFGTAESQDESRYRAIHKQRPYLNTIMCGDLDGPDISAL